MENADIRNEAQCASRRFSEKARETVDHTREWARENPLAALGIVAGVSAGIGLLVGLLIGRSGRS